MDPANELEKTIAGIWREVLRVEQFGVTDNFFDLGGSSLAMGQANGRLQETLKRKISMTEMFQYPTVRTLAAYLSDSNKAGNAPELGSSKSRGERRRETGARQAAWIACADGRFEQLAAITRTVNWKRYSRLSTTKQSGAGRYSFGS